METAIYVRVSTEEQAQEGFSIRAQEQKLKEYAGVKDWSIYKIYMDEGISGKNLTERPAIQEMLADIEKGDVKNVLVFKIDRLTRSTADLVYLVDFFNANNCAFNSLTESIDTQTPSGRMFLKIIGIFAEFERENIIERTKLGLERKIREGYKIGSFSSYGYDFEKNQEVQTINEQEAAIVREIFDMYVNQGVGVTNIVKRLNARKISTKRDSTWSSNSIRRLLSNNNYVGEVRHHVQNKQLKYSVEGRHEAIIEQELFENAQRLLESNRNTISRRPPREDNYFAGFLTCGKCNRKLTTSNVYRTLKDGSQTVTGSYRCENKTFGICTTSNISHTKVEYAFEEYIEKIADLDIADEMQIEEQRKQENQAQIQAYQNKQRQLEVKDRETLSLYIANDISLESYREIKKAIDKEKAAISAELEKLQEMQEETKIDKSDIVNNIRKNWSALSASQRRHFLLENMGNITLSTEKDGHFTVVKITNVVFLPSYEKQHETGQQKIYSR